jgi:hypothetical protein
LDGPHLIWDLQVVLFVRMVPIRILMELDYVRIVKLVNGPMVLLVKLNVGHVILVLMVLMVLRVDHALLVLHQVY